MIQSISNNKLIEFHRKIISKTGGLKGIRDAKVLDSALSRAFATYAGQELYNTLERKIAVITYSLINNHGFTDGNKRIGVSVLILLCIINDVNIRYTQKELIDLGLYVAEGRYDEEYIYNWIIEHKSSNK